jgi:hypothetical protein
VPLPWEPPSPLPLPPPGAPQGDTAGVVVWSAIKSSSSLIVNLEYKLHVRKGIISEGNSKPNNNLSPEISEFIENLPEIEPCAKADIARHT